MLLVLNENVLRLLEYFSLAFHGHHVRKKFNQR